MRVPGRYDSSLVAALAEFLDDIIWANHIFPFVFDTVKGCWLVLSCISSVEWSKFTMHYARIWSRIISDKLVDGDRTERERERRRSSHIVE